MFQKILLPLDGSKVGEAALPAVEELVSKVCPQSNVEVVLIQVLTSLTHYVVAGETSVQILYTEEELNQIKKQVTDYLEKLGAGLKARGATISLKVSVGNAADEIIKAANELGVDLIAISTHGRSGLSRWALGSVTERVIRSGERPVLVVRAGK